LLSIVRSDIVKKKYKLQKKYCNNEKYDGIKSYHDSQLVWPTLRIWRRGNFPSMSWEQFWEKDFEQTVDRNFVPSNPRDNYPTANWQGLIRPSNKIVQVSSFLGLLSDLGSGPKRYVLDV